MKARPSTVVYRVSKFVQRHRTEVSAAFTVLVVIAAAASFAFNTLGLRDRLLGSAASTGIRSLAVLPLENLSGDATQDYFSDGMTDALITDLSQISSLKVISRTSIMRYKKTDKALPQIARELNVDGIVEGTIQRSGDHVRITAQLIHGLSDKHIWANTYERNTRDVLGLEKEVTQEIARQVKARLTEPNQAPPAQPRPVNLKALDAYLQGKYYLNREGRGSGDEEKRTAQEYFQQAMDADPGFVPAYVGMVSAHDDLLLPSKNDFAIRRIGAEKAVALDPSSSDAHLALGEVRMIDEWDWPRAEEELRRAIALNPNNADAHEVLGAFLDFMGRMDESWKEFQIAQELDPNNDHLSATLEARGQYDRAIELLRRMVQSHPDDGYAHYWLSRNYAEIGMFKESVSELEQATALFGMSEIAADLHRAFATSGYRGTMRRWAKDLEQLHAANQIFLPRIVADAYANLGDKDRAFYWLEQAYQHRDVVGVSGGLVELKIDHRLDSLRSDPRFTDLLRRVGLPQ